MEPTQPNLQPQPGSPEPLPAQPELQSAPPTSPSTPAPSPAPSVQPVPQPPATPPAAPPAPPATQTPSAANDVDVIEKEWVDAAESMAAKTAGDPHAEEEGFEDLQVDYIHKRFGKDIKKPKDS